MLSPEPLVVSAYGVYYDAGGVRADPLPVRPAGFHPALLLEHASWHSNDWLMQRHLMRQRRFRDDGIEHLLAFNASEELERARRAGVHCIAGGHNCYTDPDVMRVMPGTRQFDAIYIARPVAMKRIELAAGIGSLLLLPGRERPARGELEPAAVVMPRGASVIWRKLTAKEVARQIGRSRVGLCLSAEEGGMFACIEYLLCGLPVVSTPSVGGRDEYFDDTNCIVVEPDAEAVRDGVAEWIRRDPDPAQIRRGVMERLARNRAAFRDALYDRMAAHGADPGRDTLYQRLFDPAARDALFVRQDDIAGRLLASGGPRATM